MRRFFLFCLFVLGCVGPASENHTHHQPPSVESIAANTLDSTLKLEVHKGESSGHGSAWVIEPGVAITAKHVTEGSDRFRLTTRPGEQCSIKRILEAPDEDISILTFEGCEVDPLATRALPVVEGTLAYVAGHPFWSSWSFTAGIVSDASGPRIQLDAVGEPGMSGGPVVDETGRVFGMAVSILGDPFGHTWGGETFAVPVDRILKFLDDEDKNL